MRINYILLVKQGGIKVADQNAEKNYGGDQIQVLEGLEAVRKDLVCILEVHQEEDFIILCMR